MREVLNVYDVKAGDSDEDGKWDPVATFDRRSGSVLTTLGRFYVEYSNTYPPDYKITGINTATKENVGGDVFSLGDSVIISGRIDSEMHYVRFDREERQKAMERLTGVLKEVVHFKKAAT